jgi:hypothetical protein
MQNQNFSISFSVDKSPEEVFRAVNNVRGWWSEMVEGGTERLNDEFIFRCKEFHYSKQKLTTVIPGKRVVWLVTDSSLSFIDEKDEWTGTTISFDISKKDKKTLLRFTHEGLVPDRECYDACSGGWTHYLQNSLLKLINTGKGNPDKE